MSEKSLTPLLAGRDTDHLFLQTIADHQSIEWYEGQSWPLFRVLIDSVFDVTHGITSLHRIIWRNCVSLSFFNRCCDQGVD